MRYHTLLTLLSSFTLSVAAYIVAQPDEVSVQHLEFDDYVIEPRVETYEFGDFVIESSLVIIAQADEEDDGDTDGIDWLRNDEFWCATHPEACEVDLLDVDEDEEEGC